MLQRGSHLGAGPGWRGGRSWVTAAEGGGHPTLTRTISPPPGVVFAICPAGGPGDNSLYTKVYRPVWVSGHKISDRVAGQPGQNRVLGRNRLP